jgi:predicted AlkP superfamily pyrophosphatase or phosphodiesterase
MRPRPSALPAAARPRPERNSSIRHVVLVTLDAVGETDRSIIETLPAFSRLMREGCFSYAVNSVWPSLTYVAHASMQTGRSPASHGIVHNSPLQPGVPDDRKSWYWYRKQIHCPTFFDLARKTGWSTATVSFPVTGRSRITWNFPEIGGLTGMRQAIKLAGSGTIPFLLDLILRFGKQLKGSLEPELDDFITACAVHVIKSKRPGLTAIHLLDADKAKHRFGISSPETRKALAHLDSCIQSIIAATEDAGIAESTAYIFQGDHSQFDVSRRVKLNVHLREAGLIDREAKGLRWKAWVQAAGGSAILHARGPEAEERALAVLRRTASRPEYGIARVIERSGLMPQGTGASASWAVHGMPGTEFDDGMDGRALETLDRARGAHGYRPDLPGYHTVFFASGPGISRGRELGGMDLRDTAPILGALMGFSVPAAEGSVPARLFE